MSVRLHVAVGVITNAHDEILLSLRPPDRPHGGLWEFPGGKLEVGESVQQALARELHEEIHIEVVSAKPLIRIPYDYPEQAVLLDVWQIDNWRGAPQAREGQVLRWVARDRLADYAFPSANRAILQALCLARRYAIIEGDWQAASQRLEHALQRGLRLLQLRVKSLPIEQRRVFLETALARCQHYNVDILINSEIFEPAFAGKTGLHLTRRALWQCTARPEIRHYVAASCHDLADLQRAAALGLDFAVLSPVLPTPSHPDAVPLGWEKFHDWVGRVRIPVFALGGLHEADFQRACEAGAQGIAGIRFVGECAENSKQGTLSVPCGVQSKRIGMNSGLS